MAGRVAGEGCIFAWVKVGGATYDVDDELSGSRAPFVIGVRD